MVCSSRWSFGGAGKGDGFGVTSCLVAVVVVLVATGVLASYAVAHADRVEDLVTVTVCGRVADAEVAYHLENGVLADRVDDLVSAGLLERTPHGFQGTAITIRVVGSQEFEVLADGRAVICRRL